MFSNALCFLQEQLALERKMSVSVKLVYNFTLKQSVYKEWQEDKGRNIFFPFYSAP